MNILSTIGEPLSTTTYVDRPTVKVIIKSADGNILILNDGLLPGGGINSDETHEQAIQRELLEELGMTVRDIKDIGVVVQYRNYLNKKYIVYGYTATVESAGNPANPQDLGEADFTLSWVPLDAAIIKVKSSISDLRSVFVKSDDEQGALYNRRTTLDLLRGYKAL